jgi:endonuclease YncB( thermonuclease family)
VNVMWSGSHLKYLAALLIAMLLPLCAYGQSANDITGRVVGIADGDTLTLLTDAHQQVRIRLAEIDAPESGQPYGKLSKQALSNLVFSKTVRIKTRGLDQYGRTLGRVYVGGRDVNSEMVRSGAAWAYRDYLTDYSLISMEIQAKKERRGLWTMPAGQPIAPWDWRHNRRSQEVVDVSSPVPPGQCGFKRYCRQMASCEEARFYLTRCGVSSLDGDGDGVPCEVICR